MQQCTNEKILNELKSRLLTAANATLLTESALCAHEHGWIGMCALEYLEYSPGSRGCALYIKC